MESVLTACAATAGPPSAADRLRAAKRHHRELRQERLAQRLERTNQLMESCGWTGDPLGGWGGAALNWYAMLDRAGVYSGNGPMAVTTINDRRFGRDFPVYLTELDLQALRFPSRVLCRTNSYAIGMLEGWVSYVAGAGFASEVQARPGQDVARPLVNKLQEVIDEFKLRNQWDGGEQPGLEEEPAGWVEE